MKKSRQRISVLLAVMFIVVACAAACSPKIPIQNYEYTENQSVRFIEPFGKTYLNNDLGFTLLTSNAKYLFQGKSEKSVTDKAVAYQETLFTYMKNEGYMNDTNYNCYFLLDYPFRADPNGKNMFMDYSSVGTYKQIMTTLLLISKPMANYGLVYGLANHIASTYNFSRSVPNVGINKIKEFTENPLKIAHLDLVTPSFSTDFTSGSDIQYVQKISSLLVEYIIDNVGISTLKRLLNLQAESIDAFEAEFVAIKNSWLKSIGSKTVLEADPYPALYMYNSESAPLRIVTKTASYNILKGYEEPIDSFGQGLKSEYMLIKKYLGTIESDYATIKESLYESDKNYPALEITFGSRSDIPYSYNAYYYQGMGYSQTLVFASYIHANYLISDFHQGIVNWQNIALLYTFAYFTDMYKIIYYDDQTPATLYAKVEEYLGRAYEPDDLIILYEIAIYTSNSYIDIKNYENNSTLGICLASFVEAKYGKDTMVKVFKYPTTIEDVLSKTWEDLQREFIEYLENKYDGKVQKT